MGQVFKMISKARKLGANAAVMAFKRQEAVRREESQPVFATGFLHRIADQPSEEAVLETCAKEVPPRFFFSKKNRSIPHFGRFSVIFHWEHQQKSTFSRKIRCLGGRRPQNPARNSAAHRSPRKPPVAAGRGPGKCPGPPHRPRPLPPYISLGRGKKGNPPTKV